MIRIPPDSDQMPEEFPPCDVAECKEDEITALLGGAGITEQEVVILSPGDTLRFIIRGEDQLSPEPNQPISMPIKLLNKELINAPKAQGPSSSSASGSRDAMLPPMRLQSEAEGSSASAFAYRPQTRIDST